MSTPIRWGILATGKIAGKFAEGLKVLPQAQRQAVASRHLDRAQTFAQAHGFATAHASYEALAADPEVDIVYVATPHPYHKAAALLCLSQGKHVLCEKPLALNAADAEEMFAAARANGVFLMEAMWTRFLPVWRQVMAWLDEGLIGEVQMLLADFCFRSATFDRADRKFNPQLGGGALLDIGIYPVALAYQVFQSEPEAVVSLASLGPTGTDDQSSYLFRYANGAQAVLSSSFLTNGPREAVICGSRGRIRVPMFWRGDQAIVELNDAEPAVHAFPYPATGLQCQAEHIMADLQAGRQHNALMPPDETLRIARRMDALRADWGLAYPQEYG
jgi:dihydrodiol dehydrogenase / D-xylose 1-dehydrogenase (NADP)